jgi:hypothetical protein
MILSISASKVNKSLRYRQAFCPIQYYKQKPATFFAIMQSRASFCLSTVIHLLATAKYCSGIVVAFLINNRRFNFMFMHELRQLLPYDAA